MYIRPKYTVMSILSYVSNWRIAATSNTPYISLLCEENIKTIPASGKRVNETYRGQVLVTRPSLHQCTKIHQNSFFYVRHINVATSTLLHLETHRYTYKNTDNLWIFYTWTTYTHTHLPHPPTYMHTYPHTHITHTHTRTHTHPPTSTHIHTHPHTSTHTHTHTHTHTRYPHTYTPVVHHWGLGTAM